MFSLSISFGPIGTTWRLLYKTEEKAFEHFAFANSPKDKTVDFNGDERIRLEDDFGQIASFKRDALHGIMLENLDQSKLGNIEMALHNAHVQAEGQSRAENDPALRSRVRGPSVISPIGGNGRFPGMT